MRVLSCRGAGQRRGGPKQVKARSVTEQAHKRFRCCPPRLSFGGRWLTDRTHLCYTSPDRVGERVNPAKHARITEERSTCRQIPPR
jgi:hypothetical protein